MRFSRAFPDAAPPLKALQQPLDSLPLIDPLVVRHLVLDDIVDDLHPQKLYRRLVVSEKIALLFIGFQTACHLLHHGI